MQMVDTFTTTFSKKQKQPQKQQTPYFYTQKPEKFTTFITGQDSFFNFLLLTTITFSISVLFFTNNNFN